MRNYLLLLAGLAALLLTGAARAQAVSFGPATAYATIAASNWTTYWLEMADVNGDGRPDAVALTLNYVTYASQVAVLLGTGSGTLQAPVYYSSAGQGSKYLAVADFNADGKPDLVVSDDFSAQVSVLLNTGTGTFQPAVAYATGTNTHPGEVAVADLNADGKPDLVVAAGGIVVLPGNGNGTFQAPVSYSAGFYVDATHLAVADFTADGKPDVVTIGNNNNVLVLAGTGTGALQAPVSYPAGSNSVYGVATADFTADGRPDVLTAGNSGVGVLLSSTSSTFQPLAFYPLARVVTVTNARAADVNGDNRPDVLTTNYALAATASVLLGTGTGTLQAAATFSVGPANAQSNRVATADLNADGRPDLLTPNLTANTLSVLLNTTPLAVRVALPSGQTQLSPNPAAADGTTLILSSLPAGVQRVLATLRDATGRPVAQLELLTQQGTAHAWLPTAGLASGLYVVQLTGYGQAGEVAGWLPRQRLLVL